MTARRNLGKEIDGLNRAVKDLQKRNDTLSARIADLVLSNELLLSPRPIDVSTICSAAKEYEFGLSPFQQRLVADAIARAIPKPKPSTWARFKRWLLS